MDAEAAFAIGGTDTDALVTAGTHSVENGTDKGVSEIKVGGS